MEKWPLAVFFAYEHINPDVEAAEKATAIIRDMLNRGVDPNMIAWRTIEKFGERFLRPAGDALCACIGKAQLNNENHITGRRRLIENALLTILYLCLTGRLGTYSADTA